MNFEDWFKKRHAKTGLYEKSMCGDDDSLYLKHEMQKSFKAGQQSKQAEIDAIKSKLSDIYDASDENKTVAHLLDEIQELLK